MMTLKSSIPVLALALLMAFTSSQALAQAPPQGDPALSRTWDDPRYNHNGYRNANRAGYYDEAPRYNHRGYSGGYDNGYRGGYGHKYKGHSGYGYRGGYGHKYKGQSGYGGGGRHNKGRWGHH